MAQPLLQVKTQSLAIKRCGRDHRARGFVFGRPGVSDHQPFMLSGTLPPFSASFCMTALCKAIFCSAEPSAPA